MSLQRFPKERGCIILAIIMKLSSVAKLIGCHLTTHTWLFYFYTWLHLIQNGSRFITHKMPGIFYWRKWSIGIDKRATILFRCHRPTNKHLVSTQLYLTVLTQDTVYHINWYKGPLLLTWFNVNPGYYIHYKMWDEIIINSQTSTVAPLKFGNG